MKQRIALLLIALSLGLPVIALAQEPVPTVESFPTVEQAPVTIEPTLTPADTAPVNTSELFGSIFTLLAIIAVTFVGGTLSLVAVLEFLKRKDVRDTSERLYLSTPPETQKQIHELVLTLDEARKSTESLANQLFQFAKDITDGQANS